MRVIICGKGDANSGEYRLRERLFSAKFADRTIGTIPRGTLVSTCALRDTTFPDTENRAETQAFLGPILDAFGFPAQAEWKAEKSMDGGEWIVFYLTGAGL